MDPTTATTTAECPAAGTSASAALDDGSGPRGSNPRRSRGEEASVFYVVGNEVDVREHGW